MTRLAWVFLALAFYGLTVHHLGGAMISLLFAAFVAWVQYLEK